MANVLFSRTDSPSTKPITDGQIIFDTSGNGKMYLDNGTTRLEMGGAINVDATLDATSTNPIQNKGVAGVMLSELEEVRGVTKKGFLTDALATKTLDAKIGTTDISSIGDGTVTGAISDVNGKLLKNKTISVTSDSSGWATITKSSVGIDSVAQIVCIKAVGSVWAIGRLDDTGGYYRIILINTNSGNVILATDTKIDLVVYYV